MKKWCVNTSFIGSYERFLFFPYCLLKMFSRVVVKNNHTVLVLSTYTFVTFTFKCKMHKNSSTWF